MDLHTFNSKLLGSLGIASVNDQGYLSRLDDSGSAVPITVSGRRLVLPTPEQMEKGSKDTIVFHPLSENITRGESEVLKMLRDIIMYRLTVKSVTLLLELARVAATESEHKRLDVSSQKYLKKLGDFDNRAYEFLNKVLMRIGMEPEKRLISISLRKGKQANGVLRSANFKFPVVEAINNETEVDILGLKYPSKKIRQMFQYLFDVVIGDADVRASFDYGSKNMTAPYFDALMNGFYSVATHLNEVITTHRKLLGKNEEGGDVADDMLFDLSWYEGMEYLAELRKIIPPQLGNEGNLIVKEAEKAPEKPKVKPPVDRSREPVERETSRKEEVDVPWETEDDGFAPKVRRISLDDAVGGRNDRDYRRDDRRDSRDDRDRDYRGRGRDDRDYRRDSRDDRDYRRDDRDRGRGKIRIDLGMDDNRGRDRDDRGRGRDDRDYRRRSY